MQQRLVHALNGSRAECVCVFFMNLFVFSSQVHTHRHGGLAGDSNLCASSMFRFLFFLLLTFLFHSFGVFDGTVATSIDTTEYQWLRSDCSTQLTQEMWFLIYRNRTFSCKTFRISYFFMTLSLINRQRVEKSFEFQFFFFS